MRLFSIRHGEERRWFPEADDLEAYVEQLTELTEEMRGRLEWPAQTGRHCRWCQFNHVCPAVDTVAAHELETEDSAF